MSLRTLPSVALRPCGAGNEYSAMRVSLQLIHDETMAQVRALCAAELGCGDALRTPQFRELAIRCGDVARLHAVLEAMDTPA